MELLKCQEVFVLVRIALHCEHLSECTRFYQRLIPMSEKQRFLELLATHQDPETAVKMLGYNPHETTEQILDRLSKDTEVRRAVQMAREDLEVLTEATKPPEALTDEEIINHLAREFRAGDTSKVRLDALREYLRLTGEDSPLGLGKDEEKPPEIDWNLLTLEEVETLQILLSKCVVA